MRLQRDPWELSLRPERGGRITSLRLRGEELLDQGIGVDDPHARGFVEGGAWGWDEMIPNVEAAGLLPDHGEAWRVPWTVIRHDDSTILTRCRGRLFAWELERHIDLADDVTVTYLFRNAGTAPLPAYWCAHALFRYERGMEVAVPGGERVSDLAEGTSTKFFLPRGSIDRARLRWASGTSVELRWDGETTPYVGVWACNGDLGGYRQVAIEPATGGGDRPNPVTPPPVLEAGEEIHWWLEVRDLGTTERAVNRG